MKNKKFLPSLAGSKYSNLVTAFAVIIAIEYSNDIYDIWDVMIGVLSIVLGYSFIHEANDHNDFWFSFITASLVSLGIVSIFSVGLYYFDFFPNKSPLNQDKFYIEIQRFSFFIVLTFIIQFCCIGRKQE